MEYAENPEQSRRNYKSNAMNADLNNALLEVQAYFLEAKIYQNVVEFTAPELTTQDILNLSHINRRNHELQPWVFRSDKEVRVVVFIKDKSGNYLGTSQNKGGEMIINAGDYVVLKGGEKGTVIQLEKGREYPGISSNLGQLVVERHDNVTGEPYSSIHNIDFVLSKTSVTHEKQQTDLTFEIEKIIESELPKKGDGILHGDLPYSSVRKIAERIRDYVKHGHPNK